MGPVAHCKVSFPPDCAQRRNKHGFRQHHYWQDAREYVDTGGVFRNLHEAEKTVITRESAIAWMQRTAAELVGALGTVNAGNIDSAPNSPFGPLPMRFWVAQGAEHLAGHARQLEYLQTVWGDLDNHN